MTNETEVQAVTGWFAPEPVEIQQEPTQEESQETPQESQEEVTEPIQEESQETPQESQDTNEETQEESSDEDETEKKSGKGFEKRIERFNRRIAEKEAEANYWRDIATKSGNVPVQNQPVLNTPTHSTPRPTIEQFGTNFEAYVEAVAGWTLNEARRAEQENAKVTQFQKTFAEQEAALKKANPDYDEVIQDFRSKYQSANGPTADAINTYLRESDQSASLYFELANNHDVVDRILQMSPLKAAAELGKLEDKLSTKSVSPKIVPKVSKAPKPASPESGRAPAVKTLEDYAKDSTKSQAEYRELRMRNRQKF